MSSFDDNSNPLLNEWPENYGLPPFGLIKSEHFEPALKFAMTKYTDDVKSIVENPASATFENTIAAFDRVGQLFYRVNGVFDNLCSSNGVPELQAVELKMAGPLAQFDNMIYTYPGLFSRINTVYEARQHSNGLSNEQMRLIERFHLDFVRAGARFDANAKARYGKIVEELAELCTKFTQNLLADETDITIQLNKSDLVGLPEDLISAARQAAVERNISNESGEDVYVITLSRSLVEPFITFSERRDLREKAWKLWTKRGELDATRKNLDIAAKILKLRAEQAKMHGYNTYAEYATADTMAGNPDRVMELLERVWAPAKESFQRERNALEDFIKSLGSNNSLESITIEPWDWRYYAEKVRQRSYNLDDNEIKPYFPLDRMVQAIFDCAGKLFGLRFIPRDDIIAYHPDVKTYEVRETNESTGEDRIVALFLHDNYARPHKRSGAWMSEFRSQQKNLASGNGDNVIPIVINNNNFNKGEPTLLSFDDATTLFHEFGHGLHGMLSNVTYRRLSGTSVLRDFVELPSQLYEHWLSQPVVLKAHARHYQTNEPIPDSILDKLTASKHFNQGFETIEYTASALVDVALHKRANVDDLDINEFEKEELTRLGMPDGIVMRHRPAHFQHLFSGSGYASAYYVYLWAAVLDADGFDAFLESGNCFDNATANRVKQFVYSSGNSLDPAIAFRSFRGRDPAIEPMLKKKGLI
eukprot:gene11918-15950_t